MKRIRIAGIAGAMALALIALLGVTSASASQFRAEEYPSTVNGTQGVQQKFKVSAGANIFCSTATATGTLSAASTSLTMTPTYSGCQAYGLNTTPSVGSCKYVYNITAGESSPYTGTVGVSCSKEDDSISFKGPGCTMTIPMQSALASVDFANAPGKHSRNRYVTVTFNVTKLKYTETGVFCPSAGTHEDGTYTGTSVLKGAKDGHAVGVYVDSKQVESPPLFEGEKYPTVVPTELKTSASFKFPGMNTDSFNCNTFRANFLVEGVTGELVETFKKWEGCYVGGSFKVNTNGCWFGFPVAIGESPLASGSAKITCPGGAKITFTAVYGGCSVSIPAQSGLNSMEYENTGSGANRAILAKFNITNIEYTATGVTCSKAGTYKDGQIFTTWNLKGYEFLGSEQVDGGTEYNKGKQQGIWIE